jgi:hypothetical protein
MKKFILAAGIILATFRLSHALDYYTLEDPKAYLTHVRFNYNFTYDFFEIEAKAAAGFRHFRAGEWNVGCAGAITIFIHPTHGFGGYYPVDNLIGTIRLYCEATNLGDKNIDFLFYPVVHESTHLVEGYDRGGTEEGHLYENKIFDSNEYSGFDVRWTTVNLRLYGGAIWFLYFNEKSVLNTVRPLWTRVHIGEEWTIPINDKLGFVTASDWALYYEDEVHAAVNVGVGLQFKRGGLMLHYEHQRGLGQDYQILHDRFGIEITIP